jgi:hypothetical protein
MNQFSRCFVNWLAVLLVFFIVANLAGAIRPRGLLPFRYTGFPFTFAAWGYAIEPMFDSGLLALNALIGLASSIGLAWLCAWARCRAGRSQV